MMKPVSAKDAKDRFGQLLDNAQHEPVTIERHGRPVAVLLSADEYQRLEALEDAWWATRAKAAEGDGFLGVDASEKLLRDLMNAPD